MEQIGFALQLCYKSWSFSWSSEMECFHSQVQLEKWSMRQTGWGGTYLLPLHEKPGVSNKAPKNPISLTLEIIHFGEFSCSPFILPNF
jgi:hypothetical protein